jgi:acetyl esterase/lipase
MSRRHGWWLLGLLLSAVGAMNAPPAAAADVAVTRHSNLVYTHAPDGTPLRADVYAPRSASGDPVVVVIHGGGFDNGNRSGVAGFARGLAEIGYVVVNVDYTLATQDRPGFDVQIREIRAALDWAGSSSERFGGDGRRLGVVGFSAGGYLAAMAALESDRDGPQRVRLVVTLSAPFDLADFQRLLRTRLGECGRNPTCGAVPDPPLAAFDVLSRFLGCPLQHCPAGLIRNASPVDQVTETAPGFLIFNSAHEIVPAAQADRMQQRLREVGAACSLTIVQGDAHGADYLPVVVRRVEEGLVTSLGRPQLTSDGVSGGFTARGAWISVAGCAALAGTVALGLVGARARERGTAR